MRHPPAPWKTPPDRPVLEQDQLHLWHFRLDLPSAEIEQLAQLLSSDERSRAERLLDPLKRRNAVAARGRLRQILARYLDISAEAIQFSYGSSGKPSLDTVAASDLRFNLAHSGPWALLGIGRGVNLGVDLEMIDSLLAFDKMAAHFFSPAEFSQLTTIAEHRRRRAFYRIWTCKEAWLKSQGWGFSVPQEKRKLKDAERPGKGWKVRNFPIGKGCVGAISYSDKIAEILRFKDF